MGKEKLHNYASDEEWYFSWYLQELIDAGFIDKTIYQPEAYNLSGKHTYHVESNGRKKAKDFHLMKKHIYTADWKIHWDKKALGVFIPMPHEKFKDTGFFANGLYSVIDIKGMFAGRNNTSAATFPLNQKWVYQMFGDFVQKVIPIKLFESTFVPQRYLLTDRKTQKRKIKFIPKTLEEYVQSKT